MAYLRDYQTDIMARIIDEWQRCKSVMVQMPTGTGKTRVLAALVNEELNDNNETTGRTRSVWIVAHRRELVEQIKETVEQFIIHNSQFIIGLNRTTFHNWGKPNNVSQLANAELRFIRHNWGKPNDVSQLDCDKRCSTPINKHKANHNFPLSILNSQLSYASKIHVLSIQWLARHWEDVKDEMPSLIVIDEAHHALADTYAELWRKYPEAKKLGMTATPCRMNGKGFTDLFDKLISGWSIAEFVRRGYLSVFDYVSIRRESEEQRLINELKRRGTDGDYQIKEMNEKLNRQTSIERLYDAMKRYADGKKGIVYAISIEHARNIAEYYSRRGVKAVAIDSRTPRATRKALVDDFKAGRIKVMVNVDVFSEGFDCPDVEFVQMGRPTLSLAKYLQQVGRGLRMSKGKDACMLIDNVGLYRVFGLPTRERDWQAMFEGRMTGKAETERRSRQLAATALTAYEEAIGKDEMEVVMNHERLLTYIEKAKDGDETEAKALTAYKDKRSGTWGLKRGRKITAKAQYAKVFDIKDNMAAVRFGDMRVGVIDGDGNVMMRIDRYSGMRFVKNDFVEVKDNGCKTFYIDIRTNRLYREKPEVMVFGGVEMLKMGRTLYSRTKDVYVNAQGIGRGELAWRGFYLEIPDSNVPETCRKAALTLSTGYETSACVIEGDEERAYWCCGRLADGSIIAADNDGRFYHMAKGMTPERIDGKDDMEAQLKRLKTEASARAAEKRLRKEQEEQEQRQKRLERITDAQPFKSGTKWGLKSGDRVVVPPKYRMIMPPIGKLCAFEDSPRQWGVMEVDGKVVEKARYMKVAIEENGTMKLTVIPGKVITRRK